MPAPPAALSDADGAASLLDVDRRTHGSARVVDDRGQPVAGATVTVAPGEQDWTAVVTAPGLMPVLAVCPPPPDAGPPPPPVGAGPPRPPCAADRQEPNDAWRGEVAEVQRLPPGGGVLEDPTLTPGDEDGYACEIPALALGVSVEFVPANHCASVDPRVCIELGVYRWTRSEGLADDVIDPVRGPFCGPLRDGLRSGRFGGQSLLRRAVDCDRRARVPRRRRRTRPRRRPTHLHALREAHCVTGSFACCSSSRCSSSARAATCTAASPATSTRPSPPAAA